MEVFGDKRAEMMYITKLIHKIPPSPKKTLKIESSSLVLIQAIQ